MATFTANAKHVETWGNGARVYQHAGAEPAELAHDDLLVMGYYTYYVFSLRGYIAQKKAEAGAAAAHWSAKGQAVPEYVLRELATSVDEEVAAAKAGNAENKDHAISARSACLTTGRHPDHGKAFLKVEPGMKVRIEGALYAIQTAPNNNLQLVSVEA